MILGYHLIWSAYGCWLPNDPRGSSSLEIRIPILKELGELHQGRKKIQPAGWVIEQFYEQAKSLLQFPIETFNEVERDVIAESIAQAIQAENYTCYACAVMPDHVHLLIRKHRHQAETMIAGLQAASRQLLVDRGHRRAAHPVWGGPGWKVFLDSVADIERTIRYIEDNPIKIGRPPQKWAFVKPYDGWTLPGAC